MSKAAFSRLKCLGCLVPFLLASCLTGGGRYQEKMGTGKPLYDEPTLSWTASDGNAVPYTRWLPAGRARGLIIAVPGLEEASVEWAQLGRSLAQQGYEVYSSDLRGQGRDFQHPQRGNYHRWQRWVLDVNEFASLQDHGRRLPVAYVGQSLGSLIALAAASRRETPPDALVLQAPALALAYPPWYARSVVALAQMATFNQARVTGPAALQLSKTFLMSNTPDNIAWETSTDRLCQGFSYRYLSACFNTGHHVSKLPGKYTAPVLIQYGESDKTFDLAQRQPPEFHTTFISADKELWKHPNPHASHDLLNDRLMRRETLRKTAQWIHQRLASQR